jgi:hypothetical protein
VAASSNHAGGSGSGVDAVLGSVERAVGAADDVAMLCPAVG